jgi:hypothetical protein
VRWLVESTSCSWLWAAVDCSCSSLMKIRTYASKMGQYFTFLSCARSVASLQASLPYAMKVCLHRVYIVYILDSNQNYCICSLGDNKNYFHIDLKRCSTKNVVGFLTAQRVLMSITLVTMLLLGVLFES